MDAKKIMNLKKKNVFSNSPYNGYEKKRKKTCFVFSKTPYYDGQKTIYIFFFNHPTMDSKKITNFNICCVFGQFHTIMIVLKKTFFFVFFGQNHLTMMI